MTEEGRLAIALGVAVKCPRCRGLGLVVFIRKEGGLDLRVEQDERRETTSIVASASFAEVRCERCRGSGTAEEGRLVD